MAVGPGVPFASSPIRCVVTGDASDIQMQSTLLTNTIANVMAEASIMQRTQVVMREAMAMSFQFAEVFIILAKLVMDT